MNRKNVIAIATITSIGAGITGYIIAHTINKKRKIDNTTDLESNDDKRSDNGMESFQYTLIQYIGYLKEAGLDDAEIDSIVETILGIKDKLPNEVPSLVKQMNDLMTVEYDGEKSRAFDRCNFTLLYSSISPLELFNKNNFYILAMGPEHQESMHSLANVIAGLQTTKSDEALQIIYEINQIFKDFDNNSIDVSPATFDEKFKTYVDKYVSKLDPLPDIMQIVTPPAFVTSRHIISEKDLIKKSSNRNRRTFRAITKTGPLIKKAHPQINKTHNNEEV